MARIDPRIFRAYDIRGTADDQVTAEGCHAIAQAFGSIVRERTGKDHPVLAVGRDARVTSPEYETAVVEGLVSTGCTVLRIGQTPSPVNYFTICDQKLDGGMQITASHNPAGDNGIKLSLAGAEAFAGDDIQELRTRLEAGEAPLTGKGKTQDYDAIGPYLRRLHETFGDAGHGLGVAIDTGNGVAGPLYSQALMQAGAAVTGLFLEPDGRFPNHPADPSVPDTLAHLQLTVRDEKLAVGFGFDGDGDRLGMVDEQGQIRSADEILLLLARDLLSRYPGSPVVFTVSNSSILRTELPTLGGKPIVCRVGHSFVEHAMREHGAMLGGEQSGHFFCAEDYFAFDDALVAALRVLKILKESGLPLSTVLSDFPAVYQARERRPHVPDERKAEVIEKTVAHFSKSHEVDTMDGLRVAFDDESWIGIRQSNTSPCLSICMEARSPERLQELEEFVHSYFAAHHGITL